MNGKKGKRNEKKKTNIQTNTEILSPFPFSFKKKKTIKDKMDKDYVKMTKPHVFSDYVMMRAFFPLFSFFHHYFATVFGFGSGLGLGSGPAKFLTFIFIFINEFEF